MKNLLIVVLMLLSVGAEARVGGSAPTNPDIFCVGPSGAEFCVDADGNIISSTASDTTVGTSALPFASVYADDIIASDDVTVTGDLRGVMPSTVTVLSNSTIAIPNGACGKILRLTATTDVTTSLVSTVTDASAADAGCRIVLVSSGASGRITLDDNSLFDTGVGYPHSGSIELGTGDVIEIMSIGTRWIAVGTVSDN